MPWLDPPDPYAHPPRVAAVAALRSIDVDDVEVADGWCDLDGVQVEGGELDLESVENLVISACRLDGLSIRLGEDTRVRIRRSELANCDLGPAALDSVLTSRLRNCNLRGAVFADTVRDVVLESCQLSHAYLGAATLERVVLEGCVLRETDFYRAVLSDVAFHGCEMDVVNLDGVVGERVDLRGTNLDLVGIRDLRGCLVTIDQVQGLALQLADAVGLDIENPEV